MLIATTPGSSWLSYHIAPEWLDTWKARPRFAPLPNVGRDAFSHPTDPASLPRSGGCAPDIHMLEQPDVQWDYRRPCPDIGFAAIPPWAQAVPLRWPQWSLPKIWCHGRGACHYHTQGASVSLDQQASLAPSFTPIGGVATN